MCKNAVSVGLVAAALAIKCALARLRLPRPCVRLNRAPRITKEKQRKILLLGNLLLLMCAA